MLQCLFKAARLANVAALKRIEEHSEQKFRVSHTRLFPHIDIQGTRLSVLSQRLEISKQAVSQLVDELEAMGALERIPDPEDGRAKLIRFTTRNGELSISDGLRELGRFENDIRAVLGTAEFESLHRELCRLLEYLEDGDASEP